MLAVDNVQTVCDTGIIYRVSFRGGRGHMKNVCPPWIYRWYGLAHTQLIHICPLIFFGQSVLPLLDRISKRNTDLK